MSTNKSELIDLFVNIPSTSRDLVKNTDEFKNNMKNLMTDKLFDDVVSAKFEGYVIAGGAVLDAIHSTPLNKNTDIDIWVYGSTDEKRNTIKHLLTIFNKHAIYTSFIGSVIYVWPSNIKRSFQIINSRYTDKNAIIKGFDFSCCSVLYDGDKVLCTDEFIDTIRTNKMNLNKRHIFKPERYHKLLAKGFSYELANDYQKSTYDEYITNEELVRKNTYKYYYPSDSDVDREKYMLQSIFKVGFVDYCTIDKVMQSFNYDSTIDTYTSSFPVNKLTFSKPVKGKHITAKYFVADQASYMIPINLKSLGLTQLFVYVNTNININDFVVYLAYGLLNENTTKILTDLQAVGGTSHTSWLSENNSKTFVTIKSRYMSIDDEIFTPTEFTAKYGYGLPVDTKYDISTYVVPYIMTVNGKRSAYSSFKQLRTKTIRLTTVSKIDYSEYAF